jgi:type IV pilus assembly protein PilV
MCVSRSAGITLIEVLVTLLLLSVGAMGGALLQMTALQSTHSAHQRTLASVFAVDVAERLWRGLAQGRIDQGWLPDWERRRECAEASGHVCLPALEVSLSGTGQQRVITVSWAESRFGEPGNRSSLDYVVTLPLEWSP